MCEQNKFENHQFRGSLHACGFWGFFCSSLVPRVCLLVSLLKVFSFIYFYIIKRRAFNEHVKDIQNRC